MKLTSVITRAVITRIGIATGSVIIYFRRRKLYVDDKCYEIKILPKKKIKIYRKDIINVIGIVGTSTFCVSIGEKIYLFFKEHDIALKISKRFPPTPTDISDSVDPVVDPIEVVSLTDKKIQKNRLPIRDIVWIAVAFGITYYLGQRIDGSGVNGGSGSQVIPVPKPEIIPRETTQLSWWERRTMPDWMIKDISDEGTFGQITRPTILGEKVEPIANPRPRRFVVILFTILRRIPESETNKSKIPGWMYSPIFYLLKAAYRKFNK